MKTIVLIDAVWLGHHPTYLKLFSTALLKLNCRVIALCPKPQQLTQWLSQDIPEYSQHFKAFEFSDPPAPITKALGRPLMPYRLDRAYRSLARWFQTQKKLNQISAELDVTIDLVFFAYLDDYLGTYATHGLIDRVFSYPWSGLYLHPRHLRRSGFQARSAALTLHAPLSCDLCTSIALLDEGTAPKLQQTLPHKPILTFPDFADESPPDYDFPLVKTIQQKAKNRKIVTSIGSLEKRKGLLTLLDAAQALADEPYLFVFAGKLARDTFSQAELTKIETFIASQPENCCFYLERIPTENQFNAIIASSDLLYVVYNYPHSSNLLTKAAAFEKVAIASKDFCIGERAKAFHLGPTISIDHTDELVTLLKTISNDNAFAEITKKADFKAYHAVHSLDQIADKMAQVLNLAA